MTTLNPHECRVLGVMIEKAHTVSSQYPITFNALQSGCNQKSNRLPLTNLNEDQILAAVDGLMSKKLVREVALSGSRVTKYRHIARETMGVETSELVVLAELLLRGPQTVGEIRGRASRMHPLESLDIATNVLEHLMQRDPPLVRRLAPAPGSRAERFGQMMCPDLHPLDVPAPAATAAPAGAPDPGLADRVQKLEHELQALRAEVQRLAGAAHQRLD